MKKMREMNISTIILGDYITTRSEYDTSSRSKLGSIEYLTNTANNLELKYVYTYSSLYLANKENLHKLQRTTLVTFSNHTEIKLEFNKRRTLKNPIFLGKKFESPLG